MATDKADLSADALAGADQEREEMEERHSHSREQAVFNCRVTRAEHDQNLKAFTVLNGAAKYIEGAFVICKQYQHNVPKTELRKALLSKDKELDEQKEKTKDYRQMYEYHAEQRMKEATKAAALAAELTKKAKKP